MSSLLYAPGCHRICGRSTIVLEVGLKAIPEARLSLATAGHCADGFTPLAMTWVVTATGAAAKPCRNATASWEVGIRSVAMRRFGPYCSPRT